MDACDFRTGCSQSVRLCRAPLEISEYRRLPTNAILLFRSHISFNAPPANMFPNLIPDREPTPHRKNNALSGKPRSSWKSTTHRENQVDSRKPRRFGKTAPYRENAHHARPSLHAIVEKLTANGAFVVRCWWFVARRQRPAFSWSEPRAVATGFFNARCSRFALTAGW